MKYRYRYVADMLDMIEGSKDEAVKMAIVWRNQDNANLKSVLEILYDYRRNFEIRQIPPYVRKAASGLDIYSVVDWLENKLNQKIIGAKEKYYKVISGLQMLEAKDAETLELVLTGKINLGIPLDSIQRAYPSIKGMPKINKGVASLGDLKYPGYIVEDPDGPEVFVYVNSFGNSKFIDSKGEALILPDKVKSDLVKSFSQFQNVVFSTKFVGLTKNKDKMVSKKGSENLFTKFQSGMLEDENFELHVIDSCDFLTWATFPNKHPSRPMTFEQRRSWLEKQKFNNLQIKLGNRLNQNIDNVETLRGLEDALASGTPRVSFRYYVGSALFGQGYNKINISSF